MLVYARWGLNGAYELSAEIPLIIVVYISILNNYGVLARQGLTSEGLFKCFFVYIAMHPDVNAGSAEDGDPENRFTFVQIHGQLAKHVRDFVQTCLFEPLTVPEHLT